MESELDTPPLPEHAIGFREFMLEYLLYHKLPPRAARHIANHGW